MIQVAQATAQGEKILKGKLLQLLNKQETQVAPFLSPSCYCTLGS